MFNSGAIYYHVMLAVTLLGISGGFYIVPLLCHDASLCPKITPKGCVANNDFNAIFMVFIGNFSILILSI